MNWSPLSVVLVEDSGYEDIGSPARFVSWPLLRTIVAVKGRRRRYQVRFTIFDDNRLFSIAGHIVHEAGHTDQEQEKYEHYVEHDKRVQYQQAHHASNVSGASSCFTHMRTECAQHQNNNHMKLTLDSLLDSPARRHSTVVALIGKKKC